MHFICQIVQCLSRPFTGYKSRHRSNGNLVEFSIDGHVLDVQTGRGMNIAVVRLVVASARHAPMRVHSMNLSKLVLGSCCSSI